LLNVVCSGDDFVNLVGGDGAGHRHARSFWSAVQRKNRLPLRVASSQKPTHLRSRWLSGWVTRIGGTLSVCLLSDLDLAVNHRAPDRQADFDVHRLRSIQVKSTINTPTSTQSWWTNPLNISTASVSVSATRPPAAATWFFLCTRRRTTACLYVRAVPPTRFDESTAENDVEQELVYKSKITNQQSQISWPSAVYIPPSPRDL